MSKPMKMLKRVKLSQSLKMSQLVRLSQPLKMSQPMKLSKLAKLSKPCLSDLAAITAAVIALLILASPATARAEHVRVTNPNSVNVELLGRGMLYSVNYDRVVNDDIVAGVGFGSTSLRTLSDSDTGVSTALIPIYVNYYFMREGGSPFATVGADIVTHSSRASGLKSTFSGMEFNSRAVLPTFGLGYESRSDAGFLFRVSIYGIYAKTINPWGGLTLGWCF